MQLQMYHELQKMYQTTCEAAHDINRHVTALKTWISSESCQKAEQYLSDLSDTARQLQPRIRNQKEILERSGWVYGNRKCSENDRDRALPENGADCTAYYKYMRTYKDRTSAEKAFHKKESYGDRIVQCAENCGEI